MKWGDGWLSSGSSCVLDRDQTLTRHRTIASLQFSPDFIQALQHFIIQFDGGGEKAEVPHKTRDILAHLMPQLRISRQAPLEQKQKEKLLKTKRGDTRRIL